MWIAEIGFPVTVPHDAPTIPRIGHEIHTEVRRVFRAVRGQRVLFCWNGFHGTVIGQTVPESTDRLHVYKSWPWPCSVMIGERMPFWLRACPAVARPRPDGRPKRHDVVRSLEADYGVSLNEAGRDRTVLWWLAKRAMGHGFTFEIEDVQVVDRSIHRFRHRGRGRIVTFMSTDFSGMLRVTDVSRFKAALESGIGPGKAYGCGLLLIGAEVGGKR